MPTTTNTANYNATASSDNFAIDNLWVVKGDGISQFSIFKGKPAMLKKSSDPTLIGKGTKLTGTMYFFLPKDASGKIIGAPKKMLKVANKTNIWVDGDSIAPYYLDVLANRNTWASLSGGKEMIALAEAKVSGVPSGAMASNFNGDGFTENATIRNQMNRIGVDGGLDVSNAEGLDESVSGKYFPDKSGKVHYHNFTNESLLNFSGKYFPDRHSNVTNESEFEKYGITNESMLDISGKYSPDKSRGKYFPDKSGKVHYKTDKVHYHNITNESELEKYGAEGHSNMTNESLVNFLNVEEKKFSNVTNESELQKYGADGYSAITNESLLNFTNESMLNFNNESMLNADGKFGSWVKGIFGGKEKAGKASDAAKKISDPNVAVVDAKTMEEAYKGSDTKKSFKDWVSSDGGRGVVDSITQLANVFVNKPTGGTTGTGDGFNPYDDKNQLPPKNEETTIFGMSPVTFGIVALAVVAIGSIVVIKIIKSQKAVKLKN